MKKMIFVMFLISIYSIGASALIDNANNNYISNFLIDEYDLVIIIPNEFCDLIQPYIDHKNNNNIKTFYKITDEIYDEYQGRDQAEQIKYFIKDAYDTFHIKYVLLIGGRIGQSFNWYIPVRYANINDGYVEKYFLSELYYADLYNETGNFESWDSNNNGIYAEWNTRFFKPTDELNVRPEVCVGRLPCRNKIEVKDVLNKIIDYETNSYNKEYLNNLLLIGGDTNPNVGDPFPYEGEITTEWILNYFENYDYIKLFASEGTLSSSIDVINAVNKGSKFVYFAGHGWPYKLGTFPPNSEELIDIFYNWNIPKLNNNGEYPIWLSVCCLTTSFDVSILNILKSEEYNYIKWVPESIGWRLVREKNAGAIAYIGSSSTAWGGIGDLNHDGIPEAVQKGMTSGLCNEFFKVYGQGQLDILGDVYIEALSNYVDDFSMKEDSVICKCAVQWILFGDPSLRIGGYTL